MAQAKLLIPTRANLIARGFKPVPDTRTLFTHDSIKGFVFKKVDSVKQAIACGGYLVMNQASTGGPSGMIALGATARYQYDKGLVGAIALPGRIGAHKGNVRGYYTQNAWTPPQGAFARQELPCVYTLEQTAWSHLFATGVLVGIVSKAYDGHLSDQISGGGISPTWKAGTNPHPHPDTYEITEVQAILNGGGYGGWWFRNAFASMGGYGGWTGYVDAAIKIDLDREISSKKEIYLNALGEQKARDLVSESYDRVHERWKEAGLLGTVIRRVRMKYVGGLPRAEDTRPRVYGDEFISSMNNAFTRLVPWNTMSDDEKRQAQNAASTPDKFVHPVPMGSIGVPLYASAIKGGPTGVLVDIRPSGTGTNVAPGTTYVGRLKDSTGESSAYKLFGSVIPALAAGGTQVVDVRGHEAETLQLLQYLVDGQAHATQAQREASSEYIPEGATETDSVAMGEMDQLKYDIAFRMTNSMDVATMRVICFDQEVVADAGGESLEPAVPGESAPPPLTFELETAFGRPVVYVD